MPGDDAAGRRAAAAVRALAQHACGRSALVAAGAEAALAAAPGTRQGSWAPALAEALEMLRGPPEHGPARSGPARGPLPAGPAPRLCSVCGARGSRARPLKQCGGCRGPERWCSAECQRSSWPGHKAACLQMRALVAAAAAAAPAAGSQ
jgi:hypothetical protein